MAGGGGGAWKVAYADFVTAMMAFFMVMWLTAQSKPVKQAVADYFEDPIGINRGSKSTSFIGPEDATTSGFFKTGNGPGRGIAMAMKRTEGRRNMVGVAARKPPRMIIFRYFNRTHSQGTVALFAENSAELDAAAKEQIELLVPLLAGKPNIIELRSYSAPGPLPLNSAFTDSEELNFNRSKAVKKYLIEQGIDPRRIRVSLSSQPESNDLFTQSGEEVPGSRVEIFALDEYIQRDDAQQSSAPQEQQQHEAPANDHDAHGS